MTLISVQANVAFANGARLLSRQVRLKGKELAKLETLLGTLADLGHVAAFGTDIVEPALSFQGLIELLERRLGTVAVRAALTSPDPRHVSPSYLMPVWPFDHQAGGFPASTGRFLGLDLEFVAVPSDDEELGAALPGRSGLWLIRAAPFRY